MNGLRNNTAHASSLLSWFNEVLGFEMLFCKRLSAVPENRVSGTLCRILPLANKSCTLRWGTTLPATYLVCAHKWSWKDDRTTNRW